MLNNQNTEIAKAIATAYCQTGEEICKTSLLARLIRTFDDSTFSNFLSTLSSRAYLTAGFMDLGYATVPGSNQSLHKFKFIYSDVVTGQTDERTKVFPTSLIDPLFTAKNFQAILNLLESNLTYIKQFPDGAILFSNNNYGYNIAYTTTPQSGGGAGGGIVIPDPIGNQNNNELTETIIPVNQAQKSFDLNSYILPALIGIGLYFFVGKK